MAPFQWRELADHELPKLEPRPTGVAKSTRSRPSSSVLGKRLQPYLVRFDSYLSNQRPIYESPLFNVLLRKTPSKAAQTYPAEPLFPKEDPRNPKKFSNASNPYSFPDDDSSDDSGETETPQKASSTYSFPNDSGDDSSEGSSEGSSEEEYPIDSTGKAHKVKRIKTPLSVALERWGDLLQEFDPSPNPGSEDQVLHTSDLGAWFTQPRLKPDQYPVPQDELYRRYCNPGHSHLLKRKRAIEDDPLTRWARRDWVIGRGVELKESQKSTYGASGYQYGKSTGVDATERTKLFDRLLGPFPTIPKNFRPPPSPSRPALPARFTNPLPARFIIAAQKRYLERCRNTLSTPQTRSQKRPRDFPLADDYANRSERFKRSPSSGDKPVSPYDLDLFTPRGRANHDPLKSVDITKTSHIVCKIIHRRAIADDNAFAPFIDETKYLPTSRRTSTDTDSEYLPSPPLTSADASGPETRPSQQPSSTDGFGSGNQTSKMPASTTPTPPPSTTKMPSTTKAPSTPKIVLPSKISKPRSTIPPPLPSQISAHLRTTPALSQLNSTLLLALKRQNWAHHVRVIARELLVSGRCTTYDEVLAVVIGAATQSLRNSDPDKEAKEQRKKRKRVEEGDISDDEFDSDGERVEDGIVMGGVRKKKMVERLLGELKEQGVYTDIGIPRTVVEEGVSIVKGALRDVVVYEDA